MRRLLIVGLGLLALSLVVPNATLGQQLHRENALGSLPSDLSQLGEDVIRCGEFFAVLETKEPEAWNVLWFSYKTPEVLREIYPPSTGDIGIPQPNARVEVHARDVNPTVQLRVEGDQGVMLFRMSRKAYDKAKKCLPEPQVPREEEHR